MPLAPTRQDDRTRVAHNPARDHKNNFEPTRIECEHCAKIEIDPPAPAFIHNIRDSR